MSASSFVHMLPVLAVQVNASHALSSHVGDASACAADELSMRVPSPPIAANTTARSRLRFFVICSASNWYRCEVVRIAVLQLRVSRYLHLVLEQNPGCSGPPGLQMPPVYAWQPKLVSHASSGHVGGSVAPAA